LIHEPAETWRKTAAASEKRMPIVTKERERERERERKRTAPWVKGQKGEGGACLHDKREQTG